MAFGVFCTFSLLALAWGRVGAGFLEWQLQCLRCGLSVFGAVWSGAYRGVLNLGFCGDFWGVFPLGLASAFGSGVRAWMSHRPAVLGTVSAGGSGGRSAEWRLSQGWD